MNQDRGCIVENGESLLILVADGMGGHQGGELAAQEAMDCFIESFNQQQTPVKNPILFLEVTMREAHRKVALIGLKDSPPHYPRTTCVVCLIQENNAYWAHLGDSRLYMMRDGQTNIRTRDHTYIEELFQNEVISEDEMLTHPMRNYVTYCLGGPNEAPPVSTGQIKDLKENDTFLLCSDGMWGSLDVGNINKLGDISIDNAINRMAEEAERIGHPSSDNVTLMGIRVVKPDTTNNENTREIQT
ncbi:MAG: serine/threonine-protein phosphatase [Gammaproteobacteria bacterium]|nr:serine/threonine-protein phosphatase [Gammaproteobacteria bacterium]